MLSLLSFINCMCPIVNFEYILNFYPYINSAVYDRNVYNILSSINIFYKI